MDIDISARSRHLYACGDQLSRFKKGRGERKTDAKWREKEEKIGIKKKEEKSGNSGGFAPSKNRLIES